MSRETALETAPVVAANHHDDARAMPRMRRAAWLGLTVGLACFALQGTAQAVTRDQAKRIHDRLTGTPASNAWLDQYASGSAISVARQAIDPNDATSKGFYNVVLKNFATPWTNRDQTVFAPLNDYTATVIGMVRDDVPFNTLLSADLLYVGTGVSAAYSPANNNHYAALEDGDIDLRTALSGRTQSSMNGLPSAATAGIITTRAAAEAFFIDGTNRAMFRFTLLNHLCHDLEKLEDTQRPPDRIRQDVSRSPGGDSRNFLNSCVGCHSGMDPLAQAFAYYDYDESSGSIVYTPGAVNAKYGINSDNFKPGFVTPNDNWENRWRVGHNKSLGFSSQTASSGTGAKSMGQELANSEAFANCQVEKAFKAVCFRAPGNSSDRSAVSSIVSAFKSSSYSMREVFAQTAAYCMGD